MRASDYIPGDARGLQNQLKTLFEPGASDRRIPLGESKAAAGNPAAATASENQAGRDGLGDGAR